MSVKSPRLCHQGRPSLQGKSQDSKLKAAAMTNVMGNTRHKVSPKPSSNPTRNCQSIRRLPRNATSAPVAVNRPDRSNDCRKSSHGPGASPGADTRAKWTPAPRWRLRTSRHSPLGDVKTYETGPRKLEPKRAREKEFDRRLTRPFLAGAKRRQTEHFVLSLPFLFGVHLLESLTNRKRARVIGISEMQSQAFAVRSDAGVVFHENRSRQHFSPPRQAAYKGRDEQSSWE